MSTSRAYRAVTLILPVAAGLIAGPATAADRAVPTAEPTTYGVISGLVLSDDGSLPEPPIVASLETLSAAPRLADALVSLYALPSLPTDPDYSALIDEDAEEVMVTRTDEAGRFRLEAPPGHYQLLVEERFHIRKLSSPFTLYSEQIGEFTFHLAPLSPFSPDELFPVDEDLPVRKPNVYLYPLEETEIRVTLAFPAGGRVTESNPLYLDGWRARFRPDGSFGSGYTYLYYEAQVPDNWQRERGWLVPKDEVEGFFRENLAAYGFQGAEIEDFIEFWIPLFGAMTHDEFLVYPQLAEVIDPLIELHLDPRPDSLLRLYYVVENLDTLFALISAPVIPDFERRGFAVVEWGVILDHVSASQVR